jgi:hypothetical protein
MLHLDPRSKLSAKPATPGGVLIDATSVVLATELIHSKKPSALSLFALSNLIDAAVFNDQVTTIRPHVDPLRRYGTAKSRLPLSIPLEELTVTKEERMLILRSSDIGKMGLGLVKLDKYGHPFIPKDSVDSAVTSLAEGLAPPRKTLPTNKVGANPSNVAFDPGDLEEEPETGSHLFQSEILDSFGSLYSFLQWDEAVRVPVYDPADGSVVDSYDTGIHTGSIPAMVACRADMYLEIAAKLGLPYRPDGLRTRFINQTIPRAEKDAVDVVEVALGELDTATQERINGLNKRMRAKKFSTRTPLILNYVLDQAESPGRIFEVVRDLSSTVKVRATRRFLADLDQAVNGPREDPDRVANLMTQLDSLSVDMGKELRSELAGMTLRFSLTIGADLALSYEPLSVTLVNLFHELAEPDLWEKISNWVSQRHLLFLKDPAGEGRSLHGLNKSVEKVFGAPLSSEELQQLLMLKGIET